MKNIGKGTIEMKGLCISAVVLMFLVLSLVISGCAPLSPNHIESPYLRLTETREGKRVEADYVIMMISDIQCRDKEECEELDGAFQEIGHFFKTLDPGVRKVLLVAGDITQTGSMEEMRDFIKKRALVGANRVYLVGGNHDTRSGLENLLKIIDPYPLHYKAKIGENVTLIGLSNWHDDALENKDLQKYIPQEGLDFLLQEGKRTLDAGNLLFILVHEKPEGIGKWSHPYDLMSWKKYNPNDVYNSEELKRILVQLSHGTTCRKGGICIIYIYGHTHTPPTWPDTISADDNTLFINTSSIRTTNGTYYVKKLTPQAMAGKLFDLETRRKPDQISLLIGKVFSKLFQWNEYSVARVLLLNCGSYKAHLYTQNLSEYEWYNFAYDITLAQPFECD